MKGYVAKKGSSWYAVIYEGTDPVTGKERRSWHPAGRDRADAERLAAKLANERDGSRRRSALAEFRGLPQQPVAARQTPRPRSKHPQRLPSQRSGTTSSPPSATSACGACVPTTSTPSTTGCSILATETPRSLRRRCTRSTWSSGGLSRRPCVAGSSLGTSPWSPTPPAFGPSRGSNSVPGRPMSCGPSCGRRRAPPLRGLVDGSLHRDAPQQAPRAPVAGLRREGGHHLDQPGDRRHRLRGA
jgi:hypothetical protein